MDGHANDMQMTWIGGGSGVARRRQFGPAQTQRLALVRRGEAVAVAATAAVQHLTALQRVAVEVVLVQRRTARTHVHRQPANIFFFFFGFFLLLLYLIFFNLITFFKIFIT